MAHDDLAIGLDLGTSGVKAVVVDGYGAVVARSACDYPTDRPEPDAAEQNVDDWLRARDRVLDDLAARTDAQRWGVIGLSAMLPTLVELDRTHTPVAPAITWEDGRAEPQARDILNAVGDDAVYRRTGQRLDGRYLLPMHRRLVAGGLRDDATIGAAKDLLFASLTGRLLTDPSTATGYGGYDLRREQWDDDILAATGVAATRLPDVAPSTHVEPLRAETAARWGCRAGMPVLLGAADSVLGAYGLGVRAPGSIAYIAGTSTVILGRSESLPDDPDASYLITPMADGGFGLELDLLATGSAVAWLADLLGIDDGAAGIAGLAVGDLRDSPLMLPYLSPGEQGVLCDPTLRGAVDGLTLRTTRADLARGLLAGIVLESRRCIRALGEATGRQDGVVIVGGRSAAAPAFRQGLADATGRRVVFDPAEPDHSAVGAALLAGRTVLGWTDDTRAADAEARYEVTVPDPAARAGWRERFARHERARLAQAGR